MQCVPGVSVMTSVYDRSERGTQREGGKMREIAVMMRRRRSGIEWVDGWAKKVVGDIVLHSFSHTSHPGQRK